MVTNETKIPFCNREQAPRPDKCGVGFIIRQESFENKIFGDGFPMFYKLTNGTTKPYDIDGSGAIN